VGTLLEILSFTTYPFTAMCKQMLHATTNGCYAMTFQIWMKFGVTNITKIVTC
jgi:hypothetical protein